TQYPYLLCRELLELFQQHYFALLLVHWPRLLIHRNWWIPVVAPSASCLLAILLPVMVLPQVAQTVIDSASRQSRPKRHEWHPSFDKAGEDGDTYSCRLI